MSLLDAFRSSVEEEPARARDRVEADVLAELHHHLDLATADLVATGVDPAAAAREARRRFGDLEPVRRRCLRQQLGGRVMLHKIHFVFTCMLLLAVMGFAVQNLLLHRQAMAAEEEARVVMADLQDAILDARLGAAAPATPVEHVYIEVGDLLVITDAHNSEQNVTKTVAADGEVLLPNVGWVNVAGMTRSEAEIYLTEKSRPFFVATDVNVEVVSLREAVPIKSFTSVIFSGF